MPSAKSGEACTLTAPLAPSDAKEAADADPGKVDQAADARGRSNSGTTSSTSVGEQDDPSGVAGNSGGTADDGASSSDTDSPEDADVPEPTAWVGISLTDEEGHPVPNEPYAIRLPDGTVQEGVLDEKGTARLDGIQPGQCQVSFPLIDDGEWRPA